MNWTLLVIAAWFIADCVLSRQLQAAAIYAASMERFDVKAAYDSASAGDVIYAPAGTGRWGTNLTMTKDVYIVFAGTNQSFIYDDIPNGASPQSVITLAPSGNFTNGFGNVTFREGTRTINTAVGTVALAAGDNADGKRIAIDNVRWEQMSGPAFTFDNTLGVVARYYIEFDMQLGVGYVRNSTWNGGTYGDKAIATNDMFGTDQFIFFEDGVATNYSAFVQLTTLDGDSGARYNLRRSTWLKATAETHGAEAARFRGGRAFEIHDNLFATVGGATPTLQRSGVWWISGNTVVGYAGGGDCFTFEASRVENAVPPWGAGRLERTGSDGRNPWDVNAGVGGGPFTNGTVSAGHTEIAGVRCSVPVSGSPWTDNQWRGYSIVKTSGKSVSSITRSGNTVTVNCTGHGFTHGVSSVYEVTSGGTGYTVNDVLTISGGTGSAATLTVSAVSGGVVTAVTVTTPGAYSTVPVTEYFSAASVTGGTGSGATFKLTYSYMRITIQGAAQPQYNEQGVAASISDANTFTFQLGFPGGTPTTPATGTIYCFRGYGFSDILSNTVNTIYYRHSSQGGGGGEYFLRFTNSPADTFEVYKVDQIFDQAGRMGGTLVTGDPPNLPSSNDQQTSLSYAWNNVNGSAGPVGFQSVHPYHCRGGEHWTNGVSPAGFSQYTYPHPAVLRLRSLLAAYNGESTATGTAPRPINGLNLKIR